MKKVLFSTGSARGGTNLFTKALSVNDNALVVCDPMLALFKSLRSAAIRNELDLEVDPDSPLLDYYFNEIGQKQKRAVYNATLDMDFRREESSALKESLEVRMRLTCSKVVSSLSRWEGSTYRQLFDRAFYEIKLAYGKPDATLFGVNENWAIETFPALAKAYPAADFLVILRDPRGANCSAQSLKDKKRVAPLLSFCRSWRKNVAFVEHFKSDPIFDGRLQVLRYEDFVVSPKIILKDFSERLGLSFSESMVDPRNFIDGAGKKWTVNTNIHDVHPDGIFTESIDAWRHKMDKGAIEAVEFLCGPEMRLYGYEPEYCKNGRLSERSLDFLYKNDQVKGGWRSSEDSFEQQLSSELLRYQFLAAPKVLSGDIQERYFLFERTFASLTSKH